MGKYWLRAMRTPDFFRPVRWLAARGARGCWRMANSTRSSTDQSGSKTSNSLTSATSPLISMPSRPSAALSRSVGCFRRAGPRPRRDRPRPARPSMRARSRRRSRRAPRPAADGPGRARAPDGPARRRRARASRLSLPRDLRDEVEVSGVDPRVSRDSVRLLLPRPQQRLAPQPVGQSERVRRGEVAGLRAEPDSSEVKRPIRCVPGAWYWSEEPIDAEGTSCPYASRTDQSGRPTRCA